MDHKKKDVELHRHLSKEYVDKRYFQEYSKDYHSNWNEEIVSLLPEDNNSKVLDFGCGTGILLQRINKSIKSNFGLDISFDMLKYALIICPNSNLIIGDGEQMPFPGNTWDSVISRGAIHHCPAPQKALKEIYRSLKPGGILILSEPCIDSIMIQLIRVILYKNNKKFSEIHRAFKSKCLVKMLLESGFEVIKVKRFGYIAYPLCGFPDFIPLLDHIPFNRHLTKFLILMDKLFSHIPVIQEQGWQIIIVAKK